MEAFDPYRKWLGIPPHEQPPHYYRLLGLALFESDPDVIAHAADRTMAHVRTFQGGTRASQSQEILNELATAKLCLLDSGRKAAYDAALRGKLPPTAVGPRPPAPVLPPAATNVSAPSVVTPRVVPTASVRVVAVPPGDPGAASPPLATVTAVDDPFESPMGSSRPLRMRRRGPAATMLIGIIVALVAVAVAVIFALGALDGPAPTSKPPRNAPTANP